jgi:hypothetical protein
LLSEPNSRRDVREEIERELGVALACGGSGREESHSSEAVAPWKKTCHMGDTRDLKAGEPMILLDKLVREVEDADSAFKFE